MKKKIIYYWASNEKNNNGEGILAQKFLILVKKKFKNCSFKSINRFSHLNQSTIFYKYFMPFFGVLLLWKYFFLKKNILYLNFLPAWNFLLILLLPPNTIIGPITGSINRDKYKNIIKILTLLGLNFLNFRYKKILFSHDFFKKILPKKKINFFLNF